MKKVKKRVVLVLGLIVITVTCFLRRDMLADDLREFIGFFHLTLDQGALELHVIDVGQGDSLLVRSTETVMLVDAGTFDSRAVLAEYLRSVGVDRIDCLVLTHPHADHIGGAEYIVRNFSVGRIMLCESDSTSKLLEKLLVAADELGIELIEPETDVLYTLGDLPFRVLSPVAGLRQLDTSSNNGSIVMRVEWGSTAFMLTGDAEAEVESSILERYTADELESDVLKLGHHGSNTSTTAEFLAAVSPEWVAISCGRDNDYGHPHYELLGRLKAQGIDTDHIMRTDKSGTIVFSSDGEKVVCVRPIRTK